MMRLQLYNDYRLSVSRVLPPNHKLATWASIYDSAKKQVVRKPTLREV